ncbi:MAG: hypothetical protein ACPGSC_02045 [Granulosicoccaceae bacterium]
MSQTPKPNDPRPALDRVALLVLLAALLFASPLFDWLLRERPAWYTPFILWAVLIAAIYGSTRGGNNS